MRRNKWRVGVIMVDNVIKAMQLTRLQLELFRLLMIEKVLLYFN